uniref:V-SNARE coiled-coil homology domain-containing protein n=1 Tax=Fundulus heteroclitus TaxID=8078 RepID=A0A3Q2NWI3_FUNHE
MKSRLQQKQEEVEEVKGIMLDNMNKADERSGKLNDLEQQAEDLLKMVAVADTVQRENIGASPWPLVFKCLMELILCNIDVSKYEDIWHANRPHHSGSLPLNKTNHSSPAAALAPQRG